MTSMTANRAARETAELLNDNVCPICLCKKDGKNPRHQLVMHFRRAAIQKHMQVVKAVDVESSEK
jgi:hypothetical protein